MSVNLRIFIFICGVSFSMAIIRMLIKKKFSERSSLLWFISAIGVFIIALFPKVLDFSARLFGVDYPPSVLFLFSILVLLLICFYHSVQISILSSQLRELVQNAAVKEAELKVTVDLNTEIKYKEAELLNSYEQEDNKANGIIK